MVLKAHKKKFINDGKTGPFINLNSLDENDIKLILNDFLKKFKKKRKKEKDIYCIYVDVLNDWGIMCPHPRNKRLYGGVKRSLFFIDNIRWYSCECCKCIVINETWKK